MSLAALPILGALKWPLTVAGAVVIFGLSADGTFSLIAANADKLVKPIEASPDLNVPSVGTLEPMKVAPTSPPVAKAAGIQIASVPRAVQLSYAIGPIRSFSAWRVPFENTPTSLASARIGRSAVNMRASASKSSAKLGVLAAGTPVRIGDADGGWVKVWHGGRSGWVYSTYIEGRSSNIASITAKGGAEKPRSAEIAEPKPPTVGKLVEAGSRIAVRAAPTSGASRIFRLEPGERVRIIAQDGNWAQIATSSGEGGWIKIK